MSASGLHPCDDCGTVPPSRTLYTARGTCGRVIDLLCTYCDDARRRTR